MNSPLFQFRTEVTAGFEKIGERLAAIEAAAAAKGAERAKSAAKGADFEDLLEAMLGEVARGPGDLLERTGTSTGDVIRSKKGDFVLTVNPAHTSGTELRLVIEAKDRAKSVREMRDEIRAAKENRGAAVGRRRLHPGPRPQRDRPVRPPGRRRLLRRRPRGPGPRLVRGRHPARPPAGPRQHPRARGRGRRPGRQGGAGRGPRAARAHQGAQGHPDLDRQQLEGRRGRSRPDARRGHRPGRRGGGGAQPPELTDRSALGSGRSSRRPRGGPEPGRSELRASEPVLSSPSRTAQGTGRTDRRGLRSWRARCGGGPSSSGW